MSGLSLDQVNHTSDDPLHIHAPAHQDIVGLPVNPKVRPFTFGAAYSRVSFPAKEFKTARATFSWPATRTAAECDQIGLLFVRPLKSLPVPTIDKAGDQTSAPYYVKFGLEVIGGKPVIACAGSNHLLDWSTWPTTERHLQKITIEFMRYGNGLLARVLEPGSEDDPSKAKNIRLLQWAFTDVAPDDPDVSVGLYVSRPDTDHTTKEGLTVRFDEFRVETVSGSHL